MTATTVRIAPLAVWLLLVAAPAFGQSAIVSSVTLRPTAEDREATGPHVSVNFGASVALSGTTAAIGIPHEVEDQPQRRAAFVAKARSGGIGMTTEGAYRGGHRG